MCSLLVVDDNLDAARSLDLLLRRSGYEVHLAYDGPAGLELVGNHPDGVLLGRGIRGFDPCASTFNSRRTKPVSLDAVAEYWRKAHPSPAWPVGAADPVSLFAGGLM
jgi:CheY-like chemotaxis protein